MRKPRLLSEPEAWRAFAAHIAGQSPGSLYKFASTRSLGASVDVWNAMARRAMLQRGPGESFTYADQDDIDAAVLAALWFALEAEDESPALRVASLAGSQ